MIRDDQAFLAKSVLSVTEENRRLHEIIGRLRNENEKLREHNSILVEVSEGGTDSI